MRLRIPEQVYDELIGICVGALPHKAFGLLAGPSKDAATMVFPMKENLRRSNRKIDDLFRSYGEFYFDKDRGFCFDPIELCEVKTAIEISRLVPVAVFHSHRCREPELSQIDIDMHLSPEVFAVLVGVRDPKMPEVSAYQIVRRSFNPVELSSR